MRPRRIIGAVAVGALVLTGCNRVTRITSNEVVSATCFSQSLSADGHWIAFTTRGPGAQTAQKTIRRDLRTGKNRLLSDGTNLVASDTSISADGSRIVLRTMEETPDGGKGRIVLWTSRSGVRTRISPVDESNTAAVISSDGRKVVYTAIDGLHTWMYDVGTGGRKEIVRPEGIAPTDALVPVSASATGRYVVAGGYFAGFYVLDTTAGTSWKLPGIGALYTSALDISGDGRWVAYAWQDPASSTGRQLYVWDRTTNTSKQITSLTGKDGVASVTISSDGSRIAYTVVYRNDPPTRLETIARTGGPSTPIAASKKPITDISIAGDGQTGSFCSRGTDLAPGSPAAPNLYTWS